MRVDSLRLGNCRWDIILYPYDLPSIRVAVLPHRLWDRRRLQVFVQRNDDHYDFNDHNHFDHNHNHFNIEYHDNNSAHSPDGADSNGDNLRNDSFTFLDIGSWCIWIYSILYPLHGYRLDRKYSDGNQNINVG